MKEACIRAEFTRARRICNNTRGHQCSWNDNTKEIAQEWLLHAGNQWTKKQAEKMIENKQRNGNKLTPEKRFYIKISFRWILLQISSRF